MKRSVTYDLYKGSPNFGNGIVTKSEPIGVITSEAANGEALTEEAPHTGANTPTT